MIKKLSFLVFFLCSFITFSQCDVNSNQAPFLADPSGSYDMQLIDGFISTNPLIAGYDTLTAFPHATEGELYEAVVGVRIPNDTSFVYELTPGEPQLFENVQINSISINSVQILESTNGITDLSELVWSCVNGGPDGNSINSDCVWAGGDYGCISFGFESEVPSGYAGAYRLNVLLDVVATYELFPGVPIPIEITVEDLLNYYVLIIDESGSSSLIESSDFKDIALLGISPNPAKDIFTLKYTNNNRTEIDIKVYDILGNLVVSKNDFSVFGYNEVLVNINSLVSGVYTLVLSNQSKNIIGRIVVE